MRKAFRQARFVLAAAACLLVSLFLHWRLRDMAFDDTYIHLRIARNFLRTGNAWFNTNERVMATSSPLWTVLLAVLQVPRIPALLVLLEAVLFSAASSLAFAISWKSYSVERMRWRGATAVVAAALVAAATITASLGQMETPLAVVLLLSAWLLALQGSGAFLPLLALASLTRLELLPLWATAAAVTLAGANRLKRMALFSCAVMLAGALWTLEQFHTLLPNTMRAKRIVYDFTLRQTWSQFIANRLTDHFAALLFVVLVAVAVYSVFKARSGYGASLRLLGPVLAIFAGLVVVAEYVSRRTVVFEWYRALYLAPLALGLLLLPEPPDAAKVWRLAWTGCKAGLLAYAFIGPMRTAQKVVEAAAKPTIAAKSRIDGGDFVRVQEYLQVGAVLNRMCPGRVLMASEIGGLGWAYPGVVSDAFGLASPAALAYQPLQSGAPKGGIPSEYLLHTSPDMAVTYMVMGVELWHDPRVRPDYDALKLPTSPRSLRGGPLDKAWRSSPSLDVWLRRGGECDSQMIKQALIAQIW